MSIDVEVLNFGDDDTIIDPESLDRNKHYRFIQNRPARIARARKQGYVPVSSSEVRVLSGSEEKEESADGLIRDGDRILMACNRQNRKERIKKQRELRGLRMQSPVSSFRKRVREAEATSRQRIPITTDDKE